MLICTIMIIESRRRKSSWARTSMPLPESSSGSAHVASHSTIAAVKLHGSRHTSRDNQDLGNTRVYKEYMGLREVVRGIGALGMHFVVPCQCNCCLIFLFDAILGSVLQFGAT